MWGYNMIKTIQLILYSWYLATKDIFECIGEFIHQSICCHKWSEWHEPDISNCRRHDYERWMERKCELCYKREERDV